MVFLCPSGKSTPTVATRFTGAKKLALIEKYVADPPNISFEYPKGDTIVSSATEPMTRIRFIILF